jgi:hypothetical protein
MSGKQNRTVCRSCFLYGDHCATYPREAETIIESVLETSGVVFGISDGRWPFDPERLFAAGQIYYLIPYYSQVTGGQYYTVSDPKLLSAALDYILSQLHLRYTTGFKPRVIDGKRHTIRVELSKETQRRYQGVQLRFRQEYLGVASASTSHCEMSIAFPVKGRAQSGFLGTNSTSCVSIIVRRIA